MIETFDFLRIANLECIRGGSQDETPIIMNTTVPVTGEPPVREEEEEGTKTT